METTPLKNGKFQARFWTIADAESVVLRLSRRKDSTKVIHHTTRPSLDRYDRKDNGEEFGKTPDGRLLVGDIFDHRLLGNSSVESCFGTDKRLISYYQEAVLKKGDIILVGSDGFFENFGSFDGIGTVISRSGAKSAAQIHDALFQETLIRMALLEVAKNQELNHDLYVEAYRKAIGHEPPPGWSGIYEPRERGANGELKTYCVFYRGLLDNSTGQVLDVFKKDNLTLLVQVLGEESQKPNGKSDSGASRVLRSKLLRPFFVPFWGFMGSGGIGGGDGLGGSRKKLWEALKDEPDNLDLRQVYGDLLQEAGDPRGEFITLQMLREEQVPFSEIQEKREKELQETMRQNIASPESQEINWSESRFVRGFLWEVTLTNPSVETIRRLIKYEGPFIRKLKIETNLETFRTLLASPEFRHLKHLDLKGSVLRHEGAKILTEAKHLSKLTYLDLQGNIIKTKGAKVLAKASHFSNLRHLNLGYNWIRDEGIQALVAEPHFSKLFYLDLRCNAIDDEGAQALASAECLSNLGVLRLKDNNFGAAGFAALNASPLSKVIKL